MKITLEPYSGGVYTAQSDAEHISEVVNMFKGLLVQCGYHPHNVEQQFDPCEIEPWFNNQEEPNSSILASMEAKERSAKEHFSEKDYECYSQTS